MQWLQKTDCSPYFCPCLPTAYSTHNNHSHFYYNNYNQMSLPCLKSFNGFLLHLEEGPNPLSWPIWLLLTFVNSSYLWPLALDPPCIAWTHPAFCGLAASARNPLPVDIHLDCSLTSDPYPNISLSDRPSPSTLYIKKHPSYTHSVILYLLTSTYSSS